MALEDIFNATGRRTLVLFRIGNFGNTNKAKFYEAPFNLIAINGTEYVSPRDTHRVSLKAGHDYATGTDSWATTAWRVCQGEWFVDDVMRMDECEMGDWKGNAGLIWKGVHLFGNL